MTNGRSGRQRYVGRSGFYHGPGVRCARADAGQGSLSFASYTFVKLRKALEVPAHRSEPDGQAFRGTGGRTTQIKRIKVNQGCLFYMTSSQGKSGQCRAKLEPTQPALRDGCKSRRQPFWRSPIFGDIRPFREKNCPMPDGPLGDPGSGVWAGDHRMGNQALAGAPTCRGSARRSGGQAGRLLRRNPPKSDHRKKSTGVRPSAFAKASARSCGCGTGRQAGQPTETRLSANIRRYPPKSDHRIFKRSDAGRGTSVRVRAAMASAPIVVSRAKSWLVVPTIDLKPEI
jgi:hypothetical protein